MTELLRKLALSRMQAFASQHKGEWPVGSNLGQFVTMVLEPAGLTPPEPYCAATISFAFQMAAKQNGVPMPFIYTAGALALFHQCQKKGWEVDAEDIQPQDLIFWHRGPINTGKGHVGIVEYGLNGGRLQTIEGNHANTVDHFHYDESGWRLHFAGAARVPG